VTPEEKLTGALGDDGAQVVKEFRFALTDRLGREPTTAELFRAVIDYSRNDLRRMNFSVVKSDN
jgi:hypothetical protein